MYASEGYGATYLRSWRETACWKTSAFSERIVAGWK
jgi:hypothetical protein